MNLLVSLFIISLFTTYSYAEQWICFDATTKYIMFTAEGDGTVLGISGVNNSNIKTNCILASKAEYDRAKQAYQKVDTSLVDNRIINLTQSEKDAILLAQQQAVDTARAQAIINEDNKMVQSLSAIQMDKIDASIDSIGSLNDAKAFLKKLVRYLANHITGQ